MTEASRHIDDGTLFQWLGEEFPFPMLDLSVYGSGVLHPSDEMIDVLQRIDNVGASEFGVTNNGIAMLIAYGLQAIQQGE